MPLTGSGDAYSADDPVTYLRTLAAISASDGCWTGDFDTSTTMSSASGQAQFGHAQLRVSPPLFAASLIELQWRRTSRNSHFVHRRKTVFMLSPCVTLATVTLVTRIGPDPLR